jgi:DNA-binding transcriptional MerR regulator
MAEVAPYVLRYWETEFPALSEGKEKGAARLYTARDVQIIARIRQLLYDEGFTVAGAKKRLEAEIQEGRFDDGEKPLAAPEQRRTLADEPIAPIIETRTEPAIRPRPVPAPPPTTPTAPPPAARVPVARDPVSAAPPPAPSGFPERRAVIKELKEIVRLLEKPKRR